MHEIIIFHHTVQFPNPCPGVPLAYYKCILLFVSTRSIGWYFMVDQGNILKYSTTISQANAKEQMTTKKRKRPGVKEKKGGGGEYL